MYKAGYCQIFLFFFSQWYFWKENYLILIKIFFLIWSIKISLSFPRVLVSECGAFPLVNFLELLLNAEIHGLLALCKICPNKEFFWSLFSCIRAKVWKSLLEKCPNTELFLIFIFLYLDWIQENTDQKQLRTWALLTQWITYPYLV